MSSENKARQFALERRQGVSSERVAKSTQNPNTPTTKQRKPCGCDKRKAWLNNLIPGSGDLVEKFTEATGIKKLVQGD